MAGEQDEVEAERKAEKIIIFIRNGTDSKTYQDLQDWNNMNLAANYCKKRRDGNIIIVKLFFLCSNRN